MPFKCLLNDEEHMLVLFRDTESGEFYLQATCGGIVWQTLGIRLNQDEVEDYQSSPDSLVRLAKDLCYRPSHYQDRMVSEDILRAWNA